MLGASCFFTPCSFHWRTKDYWILTIRKTCFVVFLPRLNHALSTFLSSYYHHPMRNKSPYQLWISGIALRSGDDAAVQGLEENVIPVSSLFLHLVNM